MLRGRLPSARPGLAPRPAAGPADNDTVTPDDAARRRADRAAEQPAVTPVTRIACVGAVIRDDAGRLLMILRGHDPGRGLWSIPGGRIEPGETAEAAVIREVKEETGLDVRCGPLLGRADLPGAAGAVVDISDFRAYLAPGSAAIPAAGDDAADVRWVTDAQAAAMEERGEVTPGLLAALRAWSG
jgi:8-oxo-dGTP diphosphatase